MGHIRYLNMTIRAPTVTAEVKTLLEGTSRLALGFHDFPQSFQPNSKILI